MCLFTTYFNFLRKHSTLNHNPPVQLDELNGIINMPRKWNILIDLATSYHYEKAST